MPPPDAGPKKPKRQKARFVGIRFDDAGLDEAQRRAREAGLSLGAYARQRMIDDAGPRAKRAPPTETSRLRAQHITAINRAGNLVNQGIFALNRIDPEIGTRDRLADEVAAARELLESTIPALREALAAVLSGDDREG
jgi:hypothetical protein